jgi:hypothetical protein
LEEVAQFAAELGRRPTSNQVRTRLRCGRETANRLLAEWDRAQAAPGPAGAAALLDDDGKGTQIVRTPAVDQRSATGPAPAGQPATEQAAPSKGEASPTHRWPLILLALPAFVAIWSGWVGLGELTGFGPVHPLPGIADRFTLNTAITLPIGVETYAAYALRVWLAGSGTARARRFARDSAIGSLVLGVAGQVAYHLLVAFHVTAAPWPITAAVSCLPVVVLGFGAALLHLAGEDQHE